MNNLLNTILAAVLVSGFVNTATALPVDGSFPAVTATSTMISAVSGQDSDCSQPNSGRIHRSANPEEGKTVEAIRTSVCASA